MFYLTTHSTHFIYGHMALDIWLVREETRCRHIGYSFRLTARVLLYAPSHRQDSTYYGLCYTSRGALAGTRNSSMGSPHEGSTRRPIATSESSYHGATSRSQSKRSRAKTAPVMAETDGDVVLSNCGEQTLGVRSTIGRRS